MISGVDVKNSWIPGIPDKSRYRVSARMMDRFFNGNVLLYIAADIAPARHNMPGGQ